ncbi:hypothetical protein NLU13_3080 [Sarocladium strictum]|uniref:ABC transmembrane type-1 domain-containing protein n=1 Tax=Sarocladium strictum TaxID=5046 RepID=A0AA39GLC2_SARSR|nr:hypothetical protein NLU13_3080 [Sarocladium strictum]
MATSGSSFPPALPASLDPCPACYAEHIPRPCKQTSPASRITTHGGGDQAMIGSNGITLSGGQEQRVAIARAVYSNRSIAIFDDVFSGLDTETQKHVFDAVFGAHGLLRSQQTTVILATHADRVIALDEQGSIVAQGTFETLFEEEDGYLSRFALSQGTPSDSDPSVDAAEVKPLAGPTTASGVYYYKTVGSFNTALFFSLLLVWVVMLKFPEIWLKWWGDSNVRHPGREDGKYLGVYAVFQVVGLGALGLDGRHLLMVMVVTSGKKLHSSLLTAVMNAPLSFFGSTDTGAIISRFSQDMQLIDAELPIAFLNVASNVFVVVAQAIMILPASYWLALTFPFLVGVLYATQKYYLRTSRQMRLLDLEAKTPLYSQFLETLGGLATIRAFSWQNHFIDLSDERLDRSQNPFYLLYGIQRWLNLVLDLIAAALAVVVTGVAVATRGEAMRTSSGFTGVALFNIMSLSDITLASNILDSPRALNGISFSIKPGQKVGICGRSGSGKSSIILSLFRMLELNEGRITVDDVDISTIPRVTIRERLNAIPQDAFIMNGTVRENCDPLGMSSDDQITHVLQQTQIMQVIDSKGGLDAHMTQDFLSHGQKQLFCLARSMLHPSKIIVMDEATSKFVHSIAPSRASIPPYSSESLNE